MGRAQNEKKKAEQANDTNDTSDNANDTNGTDVANRKSRIRRSVPADKVLGQRKPESELKRGEPRFLCGCRRRRCPNKECRYKFTKQELDDNAPCPQCGSQQRGCRNRVNAEGERCKYHGGRIPRGPAHHNYKHGRTSRMLPARLAEKYEAAQNDPELLSSRADVALLETRIRELIEKLDTGESVELWKAAQAAWVSVQVAFHAVQEAMGNRDTAAMASALQSLAALLDPRREKRKLGAKPKHRSLGSIISRGLRDFAVWDQLGRVIRQKTEIADREHKRLIDLDQMMTAEQASVMVGTLLSSVRRHVTDPAQLAAIGGEFATLMNLSKAGRQRNPEVAGQVMLTTEKSEREVAIEQAIEAEYKDVRKQKKKERERVATTERVNGGDEGAG